MKAIKNISHYSCDLTRAPVVFGDLKHSSALLVIDIVALLTVKQVTISQHYITDGTKPQLQGLGDEITCNLFLL